MTPKQKSEHMTSKMMGLMILCMSNRFSKLDSALMKEIVSYTWNPAFNLSRNVSATPYRIVGPP